MCVFQPSLLHLEIQLQSGSSYVIYFSKFEVLHELQRVQFYYFNLTTLRYGKNLAELTLKYKNFVVFNRSLKHWGNWLPKAFAHFSLSAGGLVCQIQIVVMRNEEHHP